MNVVACWHGVDFPQLCNLVADHCVNAKLLRSSYKNRLPLVIVLEMQ